MSYPDEPAKRRKQVSLHLTVIIQPKDLQVNCFVSFSTPFSQFDLEMLRENSLCTGVACAHDDYFQYEKNTVFFLIQIAEFNSQALDLAVFLPGRLKISLVSSPKAGNYKL